MIELEGPLGKVVDELYRDGVEKGREEAKQLIAEAHQTATSIISRAKNEASDIVRQAEIEATKEAAKIRGELELAARDLLLQLQHDLAEALAALLRPDLDRLMSDDRFVASLVEKMFGDTWSEGRPTGELRLSALASAGLFEHLLARMAKDPQDQSQVLFDLTKKGFEYRIEDSVVEITDDSILAALRQYVSEKTHEYLTRLSKQHG